VRAPFNLTPVILLSFEGEEEDKDPLTSRGKRPDLDSGASVIVKKGLRLREPASEPLFVP